LRHEDSNENYPKDGRHRPHYYLYADATCYDGSNHRTGVACATITFVFAMFVKNYRQYERKNAFIEKLSSGSECHLPRMIGTI
jgi:hypothetical protein